MEKLRELEADPKKKKNKKREREADCSNSRRRIRRSPWEDIPHHLLELFLKPLETVERPNMSRVCKGWEEFKPQPYSCFPEIVMGDLSHLIRGIMDNVEFSVTVLGSYDGWLIMKIHVWEKKELYCLLNLVTKDTIQLPILLNHRPTFYPRIFLSSTPTDPDCIAMLFDASMPGFLFTKRGGCNKWFESQCEYPFYSYPKDNNSSDSLNNSRDCLFNAIVLEGGGGGGGGCTKFYALSLQGILVAIDIDVSDLHHPTTTLTVLPVLPVKRILPSPIQYGVGCRPGQDWFPVESLGKLLVVRLFRRVIDKGIKYVDVLELDFDTMSWTTLKSLPGDQVLFVGLDCYFSISGSKIGISSSSGGGGGGGGGNCIYVYDDFHLKIFKYDMHSQEVTVYRDFPKSKLSDDYRGFWVRPGHL